MIEEGLVHLVQASVAGNGGYFGQLPEGTPLPAWSYLFVSGVADYSFEGPGALTMRRVQIDCYGDTAAQVITLATAINSVLSGYKGTLSDADSTVVLGCFRSEQLDELDDISRTSRRMLEYEIHFYE